MWRRLIELREEYLLLCGKDAGTAAGFRDYVSMRHRDDPRIFPVEFLRDQAATRAWEAQPRKRGPDLWSINGETLPEALTRPHRGLFDDDDDEKAFEKIHQRFATVDDLREDAIIKLRVAAEGSAAANQRMKQADEALKRAKGDGSVLLSAIKD
jgi:hypothetical protein